MKYYLHYTESIEIEYALYSRVKIPCILKNFYGSHDPKSSYIYCYKHEIIPVDY